MHIHSHNNYGSGKTTIRLAITMLLNFIITAAEIIGGILSGSLALISDALHNFSDGISVIISYIAIRLTKKETTFKHTFGLKRAEILAAVINSSVLIVISVYLFYEAAKRFTDPSEINAELMIIVASIGLAANIIGTLLLYADSKHSMNIKSSYLHLLSDAVSSVAVILGGLAILYLDIYWIDPLLTILIGIYIIRESIHILGDAVHILMEGAPGNISIDEIQKVVESFDEVDDIHHVHMWMIGENDVHLEAHVNVSDMLISKSDDLRMRIEKSITEHFGITHITLQFESDQCKESDLIDRH